jgi:hypothetical protein
VSFFLLGSILNQTRKEKMVLLNWSTGRPYSNNTPRAKNFLVEDAIIKERQYDVTVHPDFPAGGQSDTMDILTGIHETSSYQRIVAVSRGFRSTEEANRKSGVGDVLVICDRVEAEVPSELELFFYLRDVSFACDTLLSHSLSWNSEDEDDRVIINNGRPVIRYGLGYKKTNSTSQTVTDYELAFKMIRALISTIPEYNQAFRIQKFSDQDAILYFIDNCSGKSKIFAMFLRHSLGVNAKISCREIGRYAQAFTAHFLTRYIIERDFEYRYQIKKQSMLTYTFLASKPYQVNGFIVMVLVDLSKNERELMNARDEIKALYSLPIKHFLPGLIDYTAVEGASLPMVSWTAEAIVFKRDGGAIIRDIMDARVVPAVEWITAVFEFLSLAEQCNLYPYPINKWNVSFENGKVKYLLYVSAEQFGGMQFKDQRLSVYSAMEMILEHFGNNSEVLGARVPDILPPFGGAKGVVDFMLGNSSAVKARDIYASLKRV